MYIAFFAVSTATNMMMEIKGSTSSSGVLSCSEYTENVQISRMVIILNE